MTRDTINFGESVSLGAAIGLHALLGLALWFQPDTREPSPEIERVTVNLSEEVGFQSTSPEPVRESRAAIAPTLSENPAPVLDSAFDAPEPIPAPRPVATTAPPRPRATAAPRPRPTARPTRAPTPRATSTEPRRRPDRTAPRPAPRSGGSQIGDNFLQGSGLSNTSTETRVPASQIGASAKASIIQQISRQVRPKWQGQAPTGADAEELVTILAFELNEDGSLKGRPRVVSQSGVTAANAAQKDRHAEVAIRAVQLAAPFDLPPEYYNAWKSISGARFDRNLAR